MDNNVSEQIEYTPLQEYLMNENSMPSRPKDNWANGNLYERYVGRWSRPVAREFLKWLAVPAG